MAKTIGLRDIPVKDLVNDPSNVRHHDAPIGELEDLEVARLESTAPTLEELVKSSPPLPTEDVLALAAGIWPESDDIDEFLESVREWRKEGGVEPLG